MMPAAALPPATSDAMIARVESYRTDDGGYHASRDAAHGSAYHAFLAMGAYQDLGALPPHPERIAASLAALQSADGAFANEPGLSWGEGRFTPVFPKLMELLPALYPPRPVRRRAR